MRLPVTITLLVALAPLAAWACGGEYTDEKGNIKSTNYPGKYPKNQDCYWTVQAAPGSRIQLKCSGKNFKVEKSTGCTKDYLKVNGVYYCGKAKPIEIYVDAPMNLHFHSNNKKNQKGFSCTYTRVTGEPYDPTTMAPTPTPTTEVPITCKPETPAPTTAKPETPAPTTAKPETPAPTTAKPETPAPTPAPTTAVPETPAPTPAPTTAKPETPAPSLAPTTAKPETPAPTTAKPETPAPTTPKPETPAPTPAPTTAKPETPAPTTAKPETPAPTGPPTTSCDSILFKNNEWKEGWGGHMLLSHSGSVDGWTATITFDAHVDVFEIYTAYMDSPTSGTSFTIRNKEWNNVPQSNPMQIDFLYRFSSSVPRPNIISIKFNDEELCGGGPATTSGPGTTNVPATTPVGTNKPATTQDPNVTNPPVTTEDPNVTSGPGCFGDGKYNYDEVLDLSLRFYEAQRSGPLPSNNRISWRGDSALNDAKDQQSGEQIDLTGGYYDAGDHVKFGFPMAASVTVLAWGAIAYKDAYIAAGQMNHMKAAVKWGTDYFIKAHTEENVLYGQVGDGVEDHKWWGRPEDMTMDRPAMKITTGKPGSDLAGETAAALAATSILFADSNPTYAAECLKHAKELYSFADNNRGKYSDSIPGAAQFYKSWGGYNDELVWAAAWLYYATSSNTYLQKAESGVNSLNKPNEFSWDDKTIGAKVLLAQLTGNSVYKSATQEFCDAFVSKQKSPKGLTWHSQWGNLRYVSNAVFICLRAADLGIKTTEYYSYGRSQIHYMLGDSGRSYVVGYGNNPPKKPHHRSSSCPDPSIATCGWNEYNSNDPNPHILYGALVGGPDSNDFYEDKRNDYIKNEVTTDYNAGFQGAVAALRMDTC